MKQIQGLLNHLDGSGRPPRDVQITALKWIEENWDSGKHLVISAPTGAGKSMLARTLQIATGSPIIAPNNDLVRQYAASYPELNKYIGQEHYRCEVFRMTCRTAQRMTNCDGSGCGGCPLRQSRERAMNGSTVFNPLSLWHLIRQEGYEYDCTIVDEAHSVLNMLRTLSSSSRRLTNEEFAALRRKGFNARRIDEWILIDFLLERAQILYERANLAPTLASKTKFENRALEFEHTAKCLQAESEKYAIWFDGQRMNIQAVKVPKNTIKKVLKGRCILLSATLVKSDINEILNGEPYEYLDLASPIPVKNRKVLFAPSEFRHNYQELDPKALVKRTEEIIRAEGTPNTIVHVPYSLAAEMQPYWTLPVITHEREDKARALRQFISDGGILIGSGCTEGLDLKGDLCRLNIIAKLQWPCLGDSWVKKRRAMQDGYMWYLAETLKVVIQAAGRSTRGEDDYSRCIVLDPSFSNLIMQCKKLGLVPQYFLESIDWRLYEPNIPRLLPIQERVPERGVEIGTDIRVF